MPIYLVIVEYTMLPNGYPIYRIIESIACTLDELDVIQQQKFTPRIQSGQRISAFVFYREPENPFKDKANEGIGG